jgi:hypothetical protein
MQDALHENSIALFTEEDNMARNLHSTLTRITLMNGTAKLRPLGEKLKRSSEFAQILKRLLGTPMSLRKAGDIEQLSLSPMGKTVASH